MCTILWLAFVFVIQTVAGPTNAEPVPATPYAMLGVPMTSVEFEQAAQELTLSEAQRQMAQTLFEEYLRTAGRLVPAIEALETREITRQRARGRDPSFQLEEVAEIMQQSERIDRNLKFIEEQFFLKLSVILSDAQLEQLSRVERRRKRLRYQVRTEALPGAHVDLIALLEDLNIAEKVLQKIDPFLEHYENTLVQLLQRRHELQRDVYLRGAQWDAENRGGAISPEALSKRGRIRSPQLRTESRIRRVNVATLDAFSMVLDLRELVDLQDAYDAVAHPQYYPDRYAMRVRERLSDALKRDDLDKDVSMALAHVEELFLAEYNLIRRQLADADFVWRERIDATLSAHVDDMKRHDAEVAGILDRRRALCERAEQNVRNLLEKPDSVEDGREQALR